MESSPSVGLIFPRYAADGSKLDAEAYNRLGYRVQPHGNHWLVPPTDRTLKAGPPDALKLHPEILINGPDLRSVARKMTEFLSEDFEKHHNVLNYITVSSDLGLISKLDEVILLIELCRRQELVSMIESKILPLMRDEFGATHVAAISVDASAQQRAVSLAKILLLLKRSGRSETERLITETDIMHSISPHPLSVLEYPSCFTIYVPIAISIPISRAGCVWHFWKDGGWKGPAASTEGMMYRLQSSVSPTSKKISFYILNGTVPSAADQVWRWLRMIVAAVNRICRYMNDPHNFVDQHGHIDAQKQMQMMCGVNMLFADLQTINASDRAYDRTKVSFSVIDKLANLQKELSADSPTERMVTDGLLSLSQSKWIRKQMRRQITPYWPQIGEQLRTATRCFVHAHRHLRKEIGREGAREIQRLQRMRSFRNLNHGTFLNNEQFERLFLGGDSSVPASVPSMAVMLTLALLIDPAGFLSFRPVVRRNRA